MPRKNVPTRSKIILVVVAFLVTLYLLFVGVNYLKAWNDFKQYNNLANEVSSKFGGGFARTEKRDANCTLDEPSCPNILLSKSTEEQSYDAIQRIDDQLYAFFTSRGFSNAHKPVCLSVDEIYCGFNSDNTKTNQTVSVLVERSKMTVKIHR